MFEKKVGYFKYNNIIKNAHDHIYHDKETGRAYKLDKASSTEMLKNHKVSITTPEINVDKINELSKKQMNVSKSFLPSGVLYYNIMPVATIYPRYFENYQTFENLSNEEASVMFNYLRQALDNNIELMEADVYQKDLKFKNILYKGKDVQLVDLDGKMIGNKYNSPYHRVYQYFLYDLYEMIKKKLDIIYGEGSQIAMEEINYLFDFYNTDMDIDYPMHLIDEIEKKRVLK